MTDARGTVIYWLDQWARWMRRESNPLGYPRQALVCASGGASEEFDALADRADMQSVRGTNGAIESMPREERAAVYHVHLGDRFLYEEPVHEVYDRAVVRIEVEMRKRMVF
jgi:hypothetical protein